ncbi:hypothetical protein J7F03_38355 [Streptomyces sp. ISL-43]|uniref:hypothetical protein n=1 Tax=Streptomyces sp. ISL-43 TaxID=2819183 RepID=UPI001BE4E836|nr:hypothetical protein [Streptomyces sp. ISL-43]MBT2452796.1 hypothetical protein [Streptomyces sp. ISL-43]
MFDRGRGADLTWTIAHWERAASGFRVDRVEAGVREPASSKCGRGVLGAKARAAATVS